MSESPGMRRHMVKTAMDAPLLGRDEERRLAQRWKQDRDVEALHHLAGAHMRLVIALASRFRRYGLPFADLVQEGHVGLLEAAARFDPERDVRFSTYATWWIRAAIQDYVLRNWSIVRGGTSSSQKALFFKLRRLSANLGRGQDGEISVVQEAVAEALGVSRADVAIMDARLSRSDVSLDEPIPGDGIGPNERGDFLVDEQPLPDEWTRELIDGERRRGWLRAAMSVLDERERCIVEERRLSDNAATLEGLGSRFGISKERVRQIEHRAIEKLRHTLVERHPQVFGLGPSS